MNFINFSFKQTPFFFLILFLYTPYEVIAVSFFEGFYSPIVQEMPISRKILSGNNREIAFDQCGNLFISSPGLLWIHSSNHWKSIRLTGSPQIAVSPTEGVVISSDNQIYNLIAEKKGFALKEWLPGVYFDEKIRDILVFREQVLVVSDKKIYLLENKTFSVLAEISWETKLFPTLEAIFLQERGQTWKIASDLQLSNISSLNIEFDHILDHPEGYLIVQKDGKDPGIYSKSFERKATIPVQDTFIKDIYALDSSRYVFLSRDNRIAIMDDKVNSLYEIQDEKNIGSGIMPELLIHMGKIWVITNSRMFSYDFPARIEQMTGRPGKEFLNSKWKDEPGIIPGRSTDSSIIIHTKEYLLVSFRDSLYLQQLPDGKTMVSFPSSSIPIGVASGILYPQFFTLADSSLIVMDLVSGKWESHLLPPAIIEAEWINLLTGSVQLWLYTPRKIYQYNIHDQMFIERSPRLLSFMKMNALAEAGPQHLVGKIVSSTQPGEFFIFDTRTESTEYFRIPGYPSWYADFQVQDFDQGTFFLSYDEQFFRIKKSFHFKEAEFSTLLTSFITGKDTLFEGLCFERVSSDIQDELKAIPFRNNDLSIGLGMNNYPGDIYAFQYKMRQEEDWSDWEEGNRLLLPGLKPGRYSLSARVMNPEGAISEECEFSFKIVYPVFLGGFALFLYSLLGLAVLFVIYRRITLMRHKVYTGENEVIEIVTSPDKSAESSLKQFEYDSGSAKQDSKSKARWDKYEMVTVLFSDIQGFTKIAEEMNPEKLIDELDQFFFHFDSVVEKYNIEKIKTIGDAYMAAGGIPRKNRSNPVEVVLAALEMQQFMKQLQKTRVDFWDLRIGIHTGPVIAGIVGHKKRSYDIWGDTVNIASRMESSGEAGKVNISGETYKLVKDYYLCEYRGKIPVKYKGNLDMYFVKGLRPELSINLENMPNRKFYLKLQMLRLNDLEEFIFEKLEAESPKTLYFHTPEYARHLYHYAGLLSKAENLDMEETLLILASTLLLSAGYLVSYLNPEAEASEYALKVLPGFQFTEKQIHNISNLILASRQIPEFPNLLEKIMIDIRYEYLGRADFIKMYKLLFLERNEYLENMEIRTWKEKQIRFLEGFQYFTSGAKRLCEIGFEKQIQRIEEDDWR